MSTAKKGVKKNNSTRRKTPSGKRTREKEAEVPEGLYLEIGILFLLALCIILILGNFGLTLRFGDVFNSLFFGLFGGLEYVFPFLLFAGVCFYLVNKDNISALIKLGSSVVLFFDAGMFLQLFVTDDYNLGGYSGTYDYSASNRSGGGIISGGFFELLQKNIGKPATVIIMVIILLICLMVISGNSLFKMLSYPGREIADRAKESHLEREKDREVIREEKRLLREEEKERRLKKRAEEREEKRKRFREEAENKKHRDFFNLTVGDDSKKAPEDNSFMQNQVFNEADRPEPKAEEKPKIESQGYSPFAMSPEHMVKPKDFDKKTEPKPIPEVRLQEEKKEVHFAEPVNPVPEPVLEPEPEIRLYNDFSFHRDNSAPKEDPEALRELKKQQEEEFYDGLMQLHEVEDSDMHEITFNDEDYPEKSFFNDNISVHREDKNADHSEETFDMEIPEDPDKEEKEEPSHYDEDPEFEDEPVSVEELYPEEEPEPEEEPFTEPEPEEEPFTESDPEEELFPDDEPEDEEEPEPEDWPDLNAASAEKPEEKKEEPKKPYELPPVSLLKVGKQGGRESEDSLENTANKLQDILSSFGVKVKMLNHIQGPTVTRFEMQPEQGVKVSTILNLSNDIQMNLAARDIRIEAPIPGKAAVGIEIPNKTNTPVYLRELIESESFKSAKSKISFAVGKDIGGESVVFDIGKMPHLLIAGATGSGKSVCINTIIMSILYKATPDEVKLIMIDPKVVELSVYNGIPHLMTPVVTDPVKAAGALNWGVSEMMKRYQLFARVHVRNMDGYNEKVPELNKAGETLADGEPYVKLPQIVIIVDELADLMMVQKKDVEGSICRLAQLARAAGIHLIIATQRPSVDVITGLIKANMPSRIAFAVSSNVDSRTILDSAGAEKLLGNGDMLFYPQKYPKPERLQGAFVSDEEVQAVTDFIRAESVSLMEGAKDISDEISAAVSTDNKDSGDTVADRDETDDGRDSYFADAGRFVTEKKKATIGVLQRMFRIGFNRAARIMDQLAEAGVVSGEDGTKPRQVLMSKEEFEDYLLIGTDTGGVDDDQE